MSDPIVDLKRELLAAAERRHRHAPVRDACRRNRLLLAAATLAVAAAVTLLLTAPWSSSPSFVSRAEAALTPPAGTILHEKWQVTVSSTDPPCTTTHEPNEVWIDAASPHRYRVVLNDLPLDPRAVDPRRAACWSGTGAEFDGAFDTQRPSLRFVPPDKLTEWAGRFQFPVDPVADLRKALSAGKAHDEGETQLDGRTVVRIRLDPASDWYVDPKTFYPVETRGPGLFVQPDGPVVRLNLVMRFLTFEYLPRTEANLALTDIRSQHPNATGP